VNCDGSCVRVGEMTLTGVQKLGYNVGWGSGSVDKYHVVVSYSTGFKLGLVILGFVKSDHSGNF
jgi:hypothetical protein